VIGREVTNDKARRVRGKLKLSRLRDIERVRFIVGRIIGVPISCLINTPRQENWEAIVLVQQMAIN
jgi:hypothetical protein